MRPVLVVFSLLAAAHVGLGVAPQPGLHNKDLQWSWSWNWSWIWGSDINDKAAKQVKFELYTRNNPDEPETVTASELPVDFIYFEPTRPTKIIIHGWHGNIGRAEELKAAFLSVEDLNVIIVDWKKLDSILYPLVVERIKPIAHQVAAFIDFLESRGLASPESLHLIGHSLGAHIAGLSSLYRSSQTAIIGRITGLDPAGPLIRDNADHRLDKSHATFVDVMHTCGNLFGYPHAIGHVDFFPNGGTCSQPDCLLLDLTTGKCSHNRAYYLFRETILQGDSMMALPAAVPSEKSTSPCKTVNYSGEKVPMGLATSSSARGQYCLSTRGEEPFGYGEDVVIREAHELSSLHADVMQRAFLATPA